jgi:hypothetical protein
MFKAVLFVFLLVICSCSQKKDYSGDYYQFDPPYHYENPSTTTLTTTEDTRNTLHVTKLDENNYKVRLREGEEWIGKLNGNVISTTLESDGLQIPITLTMDSKDNTAILKLGTTGTLAPVTFKKDYRP